MLALTHAPNALMTVSGFVDAFTDAAGFSIVPQQGSTQLIQTLGDKIMTPVVYQNRSGTESLWAAGTVCANASCIGATGIRWYQFNVTGGAFPATPVQQQTWTNGNDGLFRFMPSIAVDNVGNTAIGYSTSSSTAFPGIRYAGRLEGDPSNNLGQGETHVHRSRIGTNGRWGDYRITMIDPADGMTFWHVNEYEAVTGSFNWHTRVGSFQIRRLDTDADAESDSNSNPNVFALGSGCGCPSTAVRSVGVYFPANGPFLCHGRTRLGRGRQRFHAPVRI